MSAVPHKLAPGHVPAAIAQSKMAPLGRFAGTNQMRLAIGLPWRNTDALTNLLRDIYDPASPQFHHYLTPAQFTERFGPTPADYAAVMDFARTNGFSIVGTCSNRLLVDVTGKAADVERAFHVRLNSYRHPRENRNFFAPDAEPSVDSSLPILHVSGLDNYAVPHPNLHTLPPAIKNKASPLAGSGPAGLYAGNDFRQAYVPGTPLTGAGQNVALVQFDAFYPVDITNYLSLIGLTNNAPQVVVLPVDGGVDSPGNYDDEVSLDIEMVLAMAPGVSNIYVYEAPNPSPWEDMLNQMANDNLAEQISCSWRGGGPDPAAEQIFQQMAAQGQSFFNASGDSDAVTGAFPFPSESPNITQVGATTLITDDSGNYRCESVWNWGLSRGPSFDGLGSSGGTSGSVPLPLWQLGIDMTTNLGSTTFRNTPDVSMVGDNIYITFDNGTNEMVGGTSCAAPLWAAFTALINEQGAGLGQAPVGFLNPAIYGLCRGANYAANFNDITNGNNTSSSSPSEFYAVPGYDLCTGWGTPVGTNLINALVTPETLVVVPQTNFLAVGPVGGPFIPSGWCLTLTNTGAGSIDWSCDGGSPWLSVSPASGTLAANDSTNIYLQLSGAEAFPLGDYFSVVSVTDQTLSRVQSVGVQLQIGQSIVQNGGFEAGDFTGWTVVDGSTTNALSDDVKAITDRPDVVHSGTYGAYLGQVGYLATLTQMLPTAPNQLYDLSFWLDNTVSGDGQEFVATWNGTNLLDFLDPPVLAWTNFQYLVTSAGTNTELQFAAQNDPNYFGFDDVSVTPVPPVAFGTVNFDGSDLQFNWIALAGLTYEVQFTTNLARPCWQPLADITATTNTCSATDADIIGGDCHRFYRLVLLPGSGM